MGADLGKRHPPGTPEWDGDTVPAVDETAEFAERLRELKTRSGLSYGTLAKRLHMSTSTLHRYCNGDAVPTEFAPVDRLARLCKATPDELVEIHRRWIVADAARGRERGSAAAGRDAGAGAGAGADVAPPGDEPSGLRAGESGPVGAGASGAATRAGLVSEESGAGSEPAGAVGAVAVGEAPRPKRRAVLVGAAVVAVVVSVALAVGQLTGTDGGDRKEPAGAGGQVTADRSAPGVTKSPSPSASRSGDKKSAAPSRTPGDAKPDGDDAASGDKGGGNGAGGTGGDSGAIPLSTSLRPYAFEDPCSQHYLIDSPPGEVPPPPVEQDAPTWVSALGGVASGEQFIELTVQGKGKDTVVLQALHVRTVRTGAPLDWSDYAMGVGCGGGVSTKSFAIDLDSARPDAVPKAGQRDFPYKVSESDPEVLYITANTDNHDVIWYLELEWSSGDRHGTLRLDDQGRPFRTSADTGTAAYDFPLGGTEWTEAQQG